MRRVYAQVYAMLLLLPCSDLSLTLSQLFQPILKFRRIRVLVARPAEEGGLPICAIVSIRNVQSGIWSTYCD